MSKPDIEILRRLEQLIVATKKQSDEAQTQRAEDSAVYALRCLVMLANMTMRRQPVFGLEPWHPVHEEVPLSHPAEMLLRVRDSEGKVLPPYPAIMNFYSRGLTAEIDTILFLSALSQFRELGETQVSVNVSAQSLHNADFIKTVLMKIESMKLQPHEKIIIEIHESGTSTRLSDKALRLFRKFGMSFAIDDTGLSMNDVFRLSALDGVADFIKIDRHSVCAHPDDPNSLKNVMSFVNAMLPEASVIAEGVQSAEHALEIRHQHPEIRYAQGLYLPGRGEFAGKWREVVRQKGLPSIPEKNAQAPEADILQSLKAR